MIHVSGGVDHNQIHLGIFCDFPVLALVVLQYFESHYFAVRLTCFVSLRDFACIVNGLWSTGRYYLYCMHFDMTVLVCNIICFNGPSSLHRSVG